MAKISEFRTTVRFPRKDWEFMEWLVEQGEFCCPTEVIRTAVKDFRLKHEKKK